MRDFIRGELKLLLGLEKPEPPVVKLPLEVDEIKVLKMWATVLKAKPHLTAGAPNTNVDVPRVAPAPAPVVKTPEPPKLNKATAPPVPTQATSVAPKVPSRGRGRPRKIVEREVTTPNGEVHKIKLDATGQTMPTGNTGRIPPARSKEEMEAQMATMAQQQAATASAAGGLVGTAIQYSLSKKDD